MNILFIANSPSIMSPTTDAFKAISSCSEMLNDNVHVLYLGSKTIPYSPYCKSHYAYSAIDKLTPHDFLKNFGFFKTIFFCLKKIINKLYFKLFKFNPYEVNALYNQARKIIIDFQIEKIICFETHTREKSALAKKIAKKFNNTKVLIYWLELPLKRNNQVAISYIKNVSRFIYKNCVHERYISYFISNNIKYCIVEYPLTTCKLKQSKSFEKNILFIGKLYRDIRNPSYLFQLMRFLPDYKLLIFGENNIFEFKDYIKSNNIFFEKPKPLTELYSYIETCSLLVDIQSSSTPRQSSKIASYIPSCKPILIIKKNKLSTESINLKNYIPGFLILNEDEDLEKNIIKIRKLLSIKNTDFDYQKVFYQMMPSFIYNQFKKI